MRSGGEFYGPPPRIVLILLAALVLFSTVAPTFLASREAVAAQQGQADGSSSPSKVDLDGTPVAAGTAKAAKLEAIKVVESMDYPNPDETPPGKDDRKEYILRELRASIDGTFRGDNWLEDGSAFEHDVNAAKRLRGMLADPKVDEGVKEKAREALKKVHRADRLVTEKALGATNIFGADLPKDGQLALDRARQELQKGDDKSQKGMPVDAIRDYQKAWGHADAASDLLWKAFDPDGDKLLPDQEKKLGSDPKKGDTDGDGANDGDEFYKLGTDPTKADPATSDRDEDGMTDRDEVEAGTNPLKPDTDGEGLEDGEELEGFSDPNKQDTDADGLTDDSEKRLGTDPKNPDTDGDGAADGFETYTTEESAEEGGVAVEMTGTGDVARGVEFKDLSEDKLFQGMPGQASSAMDVTSEKPFEKARVKIPFDRAKVPGGDVENLGVMYWDEGSRVFVPLNEGGVDVSGGYAWAETDHFTTFVLFHIPTWEKSFTQVACEDDGTRAPTDPNLKNLDVVLDIDSSGSMSWNDPRGYRKTASKAFVDALIEGDQAAVVDFDSRAKLLQPLTTDRAAAKAAIDRIDSSGGTNIAAGLETSLNELDRNAKPGHLKAVILLTDGEGYYYDALTRRAKDSGVAVYTIGLGYSTDEYLLRSIAEGTGGDFYHVTSAEDLPQVFRGIAEGEPAPGADEDADKDGLSDCAEINGFVGGNGVSVTTDPKDEDTDGDGATDGEEAGELATGLDGGYYPMPTNPTMADTDSDTLDDFQEVDMGLSATMIDTDVDGVDDATELAANFDPLDANPDNDHRDDAVELEKQSDPFSYDLTAVEHGAAIVMGFVTGDAGQNLADWGLDPYDYHQTFGYLAGWLASGYLVIGDVRDTIASLVRGDLVDTFLNAIGLLPLIGDAAKTVKVFATFISWADNLLVPTARWITVQFADHPTLMFAALGAAGWGDDVPLDDAAKQQLAAARNDPALIKKYLGEGVEITGKASFSKADLENTVRTATDDKGQLLWNQAKLTKSGKKAEALAVEASVKILRDLNYEVLYVGRNQPLKLATPDSKGRTEKYLSVGPDIVARKPDGTLVVVEVKGKEADLSMNSSLYRSTVDGQKRTQPAFSWLNAKSNRYLDTMKLAEDPKIGDAALELEKVLGGAPYEAVLVGYGDASTNLGKLDDATAALKSDPLDPNGRGLRG
ncbi:VWA domain-containing protein [Rubrobacter marinus]|uniref:VWA domain-containing protein n=1 Tax=Rubrobacter marinus TaxID=2653852 RepID=A0A6G8PVW3_9ACTN|nr:VWA domain-containing protein [Rubrobacter marinus]QIN78336.1 VWA domain-containing protein [Rubrobacter marinus]